LSGCAAAACRCLLLMASAARPYSQSGLLPVPWPPLLDVRDYSRWPNAASLLPSPHGCRRRRFLRDAKLDGPGLFSDWTNDVCTVLRQVQFILDKDGRWGDIVFLPIGEEAWLRYKWASYELLVLHTKQIYSSRRTTSIGMHTISIHEHWHEAWAQAPIRALLSSNLSFRACFSRLFLNYACLMFAGISINYSCADEQEVRRGSPFSVFWSGVI
jgi:hypothetical protein